MFSDVAVYFSEEEWSLLGEWEKQLYTNVMREIHSALISLGYAIINPEIVFRIKKTNDLFTTYQQPRQQSKQALKIHRDPPAFNPDIFLRITTEKAENGNDPLILEDTQLKSDSRFIEPNGLLQVLPRDHQFSKSCVSKNKESKKSISTSDIDISSDLVVIVKEEEDTCVLDHPTGNGGECLKNLPEHTSINENITVRCPTTSTIYDGEDHSAMDKKTYSTTRISAFDDWEETARQITSSTQKGHIQAEQTNMWIEYAKCLNKETTCDHDEKNSIENKKYQCVKCDKIFTMNSNLVRHQQTHTEENLYPCSECEKRFVDHSSLTEHKRIHLEKNPFKRGNRTDITSTIILQHTQISEKRFQCTGCDKHFFCRSSLMRHKRSHSEDKQYKCQDCGKGFIDNRNFRRHLRTHTGERPYACMKCKKSFSHSSNMKRHEKTHLKRKGYWGKEVSSYGTMQQIPTLCLERCLKDCL
ncbi:uncharacterized protein LOC144767458 isoform X2 [Lissotriton helveticus]